MTGPNFSIGIIVGSILNENREDCIQQEHQQGVKFAISTAWRKQSP